MSLLASVSCEQHILGSSISACGTYNQCFTHLRNDWTQEYKFTYLARKIQLTYSAEPPLIMTQDPTLTNLLDQYRNIRTTPEISAPDPSVATLIECLRAKAKSIPLEATQIGERFVNKLEDEPQKEFKTVAAHTMESYVQTLKIQYQILQNLIKLGEVVQRESDSEPEAQRHREVWWYVARTALTQVGQDL